MTRSFRPKRVSLSAAALPLGMLLMTVVLYLILGSERGPTASVAKILILVPLIPAAYGTITILLMPGVTIDHDRLTMPYLEVSFGREGVLVPLRSITIPLPTIVSIRDADGYRSKYYLYITLDDGRVFALGKIFFPGVSEVLKTMITPHPEVKGPEVK